MNEVTQAVILSAGMGKRMLPLTLHTPKPLLPIKGKNLLERKFETLPESVAEILLIIGHQGEKIREYFGTEWNGKKVTYAVQTELNGTAGALIAAKDMLHERFIVMMGDDLYGKEDVKEMLRHDLAIGVQEILSQEMYGEVRANARGNFTAIDETKHFVERGFINTGIYTLDRELLDVPPVPIGGSSTEFGLPHTLALLAQRRPVDIVLVGQWIKITTPEDLQEAEKLLQ